MGNAEYMGTLLETKMRVTETLFCLACALCVGLVRGDSGRDDDEVLAIVFGTMGGLIFIFIVAYGFVYYDKTQAEKRLKKIEEENAIRDAMGMSPSSESSDPGFDATARNQEPTNNDSSSS